MASSFNSDIREELRRKWLNLIDNALRTNQKETAAAMKMVTETMLQFVEEYACSEEHRSEANECRLPDDFSKSASSFQQAHTHFEDDAKPSDAPKAEVQVPTSNLLPTNAQPVFEFGQTLLLMCDRVCELSKLENFVRIDYTGWILSDIYDDITRNADLTTFQRLVMILNADWLQLEHGVTGALDDLEHFCNLIHEQRPDMSIFLVGIVDEDIVATNVYDYNGSAEAFNLALKQRCDRMKGPVAFVASSDYESSLFLHRWQRSRKKG